MKIITSTLVAVCAIPSANAALRGVATTAANTSSSSELVNVDATKNNNDASPSHRKLPYDGTGTWYWEYSGYTYTTSGTYEDRFCYMYESDLQPGKPLYDSMRILYCLSQIDDTDPSFNQPSGQPSLGELGLPGQYVAVFANGYDAGYCSNLKEHVIGTPEAQIYASEFECCQENFAEQTAGFCISQLPDDLQPSAQPSIGLLGIAGKYAAIHANGYEDGYCSNLKADIENVPEASLYDTEYECCADVFPGEEYCLSQIDDTDPSFNQPSGQPSLGELGLPGQYVAVFANGREEGYCSNLKEYVIGTSEAQIYASEFECCQENFADQ
ncbi:hypothetical protein ACHAWT_000740, partial [Skeletonema menzelii]